MTFKPQSLPWPGTHAVLMVHGIGDASSGRDAAFPIDAVRAILGAGAATTAIYRLNYDFIDDWMAAKTNLTAGVDAVTNLLRIKFGDDTTSAVIAEYAGDVLWPILSADIRFAIRDAYLAQLQQMQIDRGEAALARGEDPLDYTITIVAHSLGCFHTYEVLTAAALEPSHELQPASDLVTFASVILMASPVQLIRTIANGIGALVPDAANLATLAAPLSIPSETKKGRPVPCTSRFVSVTGTHDPVGGHLLGRKLEWAYMDIPGQRSIIVPQQGLNIGNGAQLAAALGEAFATGAPSVNDPHSWTAYIEGQGPLLQTSVLA
jgi:hypothetical protein